MSPTEEPSMEKKPTDNGVKMDGKKKNATKEEETLQKQPSDVKMKPVETNASNPAPKKEQGTENPKGKAGPIKAILEPRMKTEKVEQGASPNATNKAEEATTIADAVMTNDNMSATERHEAVVSAIRAALLSELLPEKAAEKVYESTSSHTDRDRIISSTLHTILPTLPLEGALRLIDVSTHLPYPARHTIALIEALTKTLTTEALSAALPSLKPRIDTIRTRPITDIHLIRLLRSLISRDPHAANPVLLGSLKLLIASALPPWHMSGMNKRGKYNTHVLPLIPTPAEPALARALTSFTNACRYPPGCEQPSGWVTAREGLRVLLDAFDVGKLTEVQTLICVQAAILFQHLEFDGGAFGKSLFNGGEGAALRRRVLDGLDAGFRRFVMVMLNRERRWVRWKKTMEHTKVAKVEIAGEFKRRVIRKSSGYEPGIERMGMPKLSWKVFEEKTGTDGVKKLIEEVKEDKDEAEEDKRKGDSKYTWRALRTLSEESVALMAKVVDDKGKVDLERILSEEVSV